MKPYSELPRRLPALEPYDEDALDSLSFPDDNSLDTEPVESEPVGEDMPDIKQRILGCLACISKDDSEPVGDAVRLISDCLAAEHTQIKRRFRALLEERLITAIPRTSRPMLGVRTPSKSDFVLSEEGRIALGTAHNVCTEKINQDPFRYAGGVQLDILRCISCAAAKGDGAQTAKIALCTGKSPVHIQQECNDFVKRGLVTKQGDERSELKNRTGPQTAHHFTAIAVPFAPSPEGQGCPYEERKIEILMTTLTAKQRFIIGAFNRLAATGGVEATRREIGVYANMSRTQARSRLEPLVGMNIFSEELRTTESGSYCVLRPTEIGGQLIEMVRSYDERIAAKVIDIALDQDEGDKPASISVAQLSEQLSIPPILVQQYLEERLKGARPSRRSMDKVYYISSDTLSSDSALVLSLPADVVEKIVRQKQASQTIHDNAIEKMRAYLTDYENAVLSNMLGLHKWSQRQITMRFGVSQPAVQEAQLRIEALLRHPYFGTAAGRKSHKWQLKAACAKTDDGRVVERSVSRDVPPEVAKLCGLCPVRKECFTETLRGDRPVDAGIWAGFTSSQLRTYYRRSRSASVTKKPAPETSIAHS